MERKFELPTSLAGFEDHATCSLSIDGQALGKSSVDGTRTGT
jgi:hypothetical protein